MVISFSSIFHKAWGRLGVLLVSCCLFWKLLYLFVKTPSLSEAHDHGILYALGNSFPKLPVISSHLLETFVIDFTVPFVCLSIGNIQIRTSTTWTLSSLTALSLMNVPFIYPQLHIPWPYSELVITKHFIFHKILISGIPLTDWQIFLAY